MLISMRFIQRLQNGAFRKVDTNIYKEVSLVCAILIA